MSLSILPSLSQSRQVRVNLNNSESISLTPNLSQQVSANPTRFWLIPPNSGFDFAHHILQSRRLHVKVTGMPELVVFAEFKPYLKAADEDEALYNEE